MGVVNIVSKERVYLRVTQKARLPWLTDQFYMMLNKKEESWWALRFLTDDGAIDSARKTQYGRKAGIWWRQFLSCVLNLRPPVGGDEESAQDGISTW